MVDERNMHDFHLDSELNPFQKKSNEVLNNILSLSLIPVVFSLILWWRRVCWIWAETHLGGHKLGSLYLNVFRKTWK